MQSTPADAGVADATDVDNATEATDASSTTDAATVDRSEPDPSADAEDRAQASARTDVVSPEELSAAAEQSAEEPDADQPGLSELRKELNDQFESIKIVNPGQYELNLMELYDRDEYIISLREDGRYVIEVPDRWNDGDEDE
ncbi:OapC/ArvC family zinc-ribbon domain-containing protein [Halobium salinum]|uniref:OapC/ArvC family zinc-ribbon domain-containing protein n=1 Tax=Halobium salinum TaxID=1364940 RepID=UPI0036F2D1AB